MGKVLESVESYRQHKSDPADKVLNSALTGTRLHLVKQRGLGVYSLTHSLTKTNTT